MNKLICEPNLSDCRYFWSLTHRLLSHLPPLISLTFSYLTHPLLSHSPPLISLTASYLSHRLLSHSPPFMSVTSSYLTYLLLCHLPPLMSLTASYLTHRQVSLNCLFPATHTWSRQTQTRRNKRKLEHRVVWSRVLLSTFLSSASSFLSAESIKTVKRKLR